MPVPMPMVTQGVSILSPASTYPDLLLINNAGQGLNNTPSQIQDGLGNMTSMIISSNYINFDRTFAQFQLDGVPLTASAATLNSITDVANGEYLLLTPNVQLANASVLTARNGISLNLGAGSAIVEADPASILFGIQQLNAGPNGIVVYFNNTFFQTVDLIPFDATINIQNGDGVAGNPSFNVVTDTSRQRVNVELNGVFESQKSQLNFIPGNGAGIVVTDNPASNRTDITISSIPQFSFKFLGSVYASTTVAGGNLNATYNNGAGTLTEIGNGALTLDAVNPPLNSLVLVNNQTAQAQNGIYVVTAPGTVGTPYILTRSPTFNTPATIIPGAFVIVANGATLAGTLWIQTNVVNVIGTDPIHFVEFTLTGSVNSTLGVTQAGHGLVVGNVIRINNAGNYVVAQANNQANATSVVGIVVVVTDANNFTFQYGGIVTALAGLTTGSPYFLDPAVAGGYTTAIPNVAGEVVLPLFAALSPITALWQPKSAIELM